MGGWRWTRFPDEAEPWLLYVRRIDGTVTWGWDEEDDPELVPEGTVIMVTTSEAADQLGIKAKSVAILIKRGLIAATKRGRDYWIEASEVDRYARERRPPHRPHTLH